MKNKNLAQSKILEGYSKESIDLIEKNGKRYVLKKWKNVDKGQKSIEKQVSFEEIISGSIRIKSPKVIDSYTNNEGEFVAIMEYIEGLSGYDLHKISSFQFAKNLKQVFALVLSRNIDSSNLIPLQTKLLKNKLETIKKECFDNEIVEYIDGLIKILKNDTSLDVLIGSCHGDLTTSNIIATGPSNFFLIDFLPCFVESPLWDLCKIRQDLIYGWSTRKIKGYKLNNNRILYNSIIPHQINPNTDSSNFVEKIFDAINIARIAPYIRDELTLIWVRNKLSFCLNQLKL